jgi:site-specific recombinase XerD
MTNPNRPPSLIQRYREELQARHDARRTVKTYEQWLRRFLWFHGMRHPREMGSAEVNAFLTHLAVEGQVSASTQNQALSALLFLYRELLERDLDLEGVVRARKPQRLQRSGAGNGSFPSIGAGKIQPQNNRDAIISIRA